MCLAHKNASELTVKLWCSLTGMHVALCGTQKGKAEKGKYTGRKIKEDSELFCKQQRKSLYL